MYKYILWYQTHAFMHRYIDECISTYFETRYMYLCTDTLHLWHEITDKIDIKYTGWN